MGLDIVHTLPKRGLLIGGEWRQARSGRDFLTLNPATGSPIASIPEAGVEDVDAAVASARRAIDEGAWGRMTGADRARVLRRLADLVERHRERFVELEAIDAGKPLAASRRQDVPAAIDCLAYYSGWADKIHGEVVPARADALTYVTRKPVGVVAAITPWNFPLMNAVWKIAPALAAGCAVVLKPAELTPLSSLLLGELAIEAGLPAGALNILPGFGTVAGQALIEHPGVDKISFTGSPAVGKHIMGVAARDCKHVTLELGGKSPNIVFADADLQAAANASSSGVFFNAGQVCSSGTRIFVQRAVYERFLELFADRASRLKLGDPFDPETTMGPVISEKQRDRVMSYVETGKREGAALIAGGEALDRPGYFIAPTIFADADNLMTIAREEIFGPVATVIPFDEPDAAIRDANDSPFSLAAAVWTRDVTRAHVMADRLRAGTVWINTYGPTDTRLPWGGMGGESGVGRDLGRAALDNYTEQKTVWLQLRA
ncbi:aldehyde dehydrogenase family protein [Terrarubrum flagellatum]|uniref:aldehyde dehydrogenase family protein n=1 Tax=Terrirubrum flagellatum TaxID=2895980 RepID=UPI00314525E6